MINPEAKTDQNKAAFNPFAGSEVESITYVTQSQSELWTACTLGGVDANKAYNESISLILEGELDTSSLEYAIQTLIERHESLRATFSTDGRFMTIFKNLPIIIKHQDISNFTGTEKDKFIANYLSKDANYIFNLVKGPLFKAGFIKIAEHKHQLVLTAHHIICDGWSFGIMLEELGSLYTAHKLKINHTLPKAESFITYTDEQQAFLTSEEYNANEIYWLNQFNNSDPELTLPTDFPRPRLRTYKSERFDAKMNPYLLEFLKKTGIEAGCSFVTTLLTAFEVFICTQTGQDDIVIGLPSADQAASGRTQMIGHCVNLLPIRSKMDTNMSFSDYLKLRKVQLFDAYEHQRFSFGQLLQKLNISRDPSRVPLVPVVFNIDMGMDDCVSFHDLKHTLKSNPREHEIFEIFLNASGSKDDLVFEWSYKEALFKPETIKNMMASFETIIEKLISNPNKPLSEIITSDYVPYYNELNNTEAVYPTEPLHILLQNQAKLFSNKTAIEFKDTQVSYEGLQKRANQLSHYLINEGVSTGDLVGVSLNRGPELLATLMAILQCGAAYVPLDPNYPKSRLEFILLDSQAKYLITNKDNSLHIDDSIKQLYIEDALLQENTLPNTPLDVVVNQNDLAYILYTSGSTGKPKGVPITHKNLVNLLFSISKEPGITENDKFLAITTISFDIAGVELFLPILNGACIVMADAETARNGELLLDILKTKEISIVQATPTTWKMLLESKWVQPLPITAFCGGEALTSELAQKIMSKCKKLWNMYGPTETTIYSIIKEIKADDELITIGKPIANTQIFILNASGQLAKPGTIGEITIAGDGVAEGYWKRPELTAEKFIKNAFNSNTNTVLYRTGDLGKLLPSNNILCLGRTDHQIKIRGYRIEPEEIEKTLIQLNNIQEAVVLVNNDALIAFVKPIAFDNFTSEHINEWKSNLTDKLPSYFVPNQIKVVKEFPTTPNGKLDRKALLDSETIKVEASHISEPKTDTEKLIASIWKKYLHLDYVDVRNNFFELGGNSLIAIQVMNELEKETGKKLPLSSLFEYSNIEKFSQLLHSENNTNTWSSLVPIKPQGTKTPIYMVHGAGMEVLIFKELANNLDPDQPVYGLQAKALFNDSNSFDTIEKIAIHYVDTILDANPNGPFALAGYSFGGIIAYEMARTLIERGKKVTMVGLFDTVIEPHFYHESPVQKKAAIHAYKTKRRLQFLKEMTQSWENIKFHIHRKKDFLLNQYVQTKHFETDQDQIKYEEFLKTESIIQPIKDKYYMRPQPINVDLFRAEEHTSYLDDTIFTGWKDFALNGVTVHNTPGNHDTLLTSENAKEVARIFQNVLDVRNRELFKMKPL
ncbi:amino acid adenylation domain-containing protein [Mariniflexile fucanivorans]|uniref:Amino acid adenylation domain-containing protein n=1 Tax=Mariniflexile fucanivorans TaxID=264023 RepID=A0A4R1RLN7_9FLAO|nr:non-ribosomal peptide synthetase [Mariniflexile fucanivorans]TCL66682.1 amino acid adenylation domain-containing protein [Mariniflexile fucanivorans]